ncbi:hypothetical protein S245_008371 [Arachis hypogaea]
MAFHHRRKLMPEICESLCHVEQNCSSNYDDCLKICSTNPQYYYYSQPPPLPPPLIPFFPLDDTSDHGKSHVLSPLLGPCSLRYRSCFLRFYLLCNLRKDLQKEEKILIATIESSNTE